MATTIGIISIGEMGLGFGQLLSAHNYRIVTNASDRSEATRSRARSANIELLPGDRELVEQCDYILSIVPPRDAIETAERISKSAELIRKGLTVHKQIHYLDLNAVSPSTARHIATIFNSNPAIRFIDGCIIGGVPHPKPTKGNTAVEWHCPSVIISGPHNMPASPLSKHINIQYLNDTIGAASGLKMCFGINTKGFTALAIQSFTTAHRLGVLPELRFYLEKYFNTTLQLAENGLVTMPPKAYRWVHEMLEMADTVSDDGGFERNLFQGVSEVYRTVSEDSDLGMEKPGARSRGKTVEDVVKMLSDGMDKKKLRKE